MNEYRMLTKNKMRKRNVDMIQVNLGNRCNQACAHCHIEASPEGNNNMTPDIAHKIIRKLQQLRIKNIEFTGGAPELNPCLKMFIEKLSVSGKSISVRSNLTILNQHEFAWFTDFYKKHTVKIIASLPDSFPDTTDSQRGKGVFSSSIEALKNLNSIGYGNNGYSLDLVYNPSGDFLPPAQSALECKYRKTLLENHGIQFNNLISITNVPIKRFRDYLHSEGKIDIYMELLKSKFNPQTLESIMCRHLLSVDYEGYVYDCDFNLALGNRIKGYENVKFWNIDLDSFNPEITIDEHCYACTAGTGSSCHGTVIKEEKDADVKNIVKQYYGEELKQTSDLKTGACCTAEAPPAHIQEALSLINDEIQMKYYGCGSPIPACLEGLTVLDTGCGTGRDCYIMSKLVGKRGFVYGIDMTEGQLKIAQKHLSNQTKRFGYKKPNAKFILDYLENIEKHFESESLDLVTSNCVINLVENKETVLSQIYKALKQGGEFYFSDVYADRRSPDAIRNNPVLYGECLGGALYCKDFERLARKVGFTDLRIISKKEIPITNPEIKNLVGNVNFHSITYRLWKLKGLEDACEDYGHTAVYKGGMPESPFQFILDSGHVFEKNKPERVCGNTALMLSQTRFRKYFTVIGNFNEHFGLFGGCVSNPENKADTGPGFGTGGTSCC